MGKLRPGKLLRKTNPIENTPVLKDYHDLKHYAELPEYKEYREAMIFLSNSWDAQTVFARSYFNGKKEDDIILRLDTLFLCLCKAAELRHRFLADFVLRFEGVPSDSLQGFFNELHNQIDFSFCINMTARPQENGKLMIVVWAEKHELPLEKITPNQEKIEYLLKEAHGIKANLDKFIHDSWSGKVEKLEAEIDRLKKLHRPFPMGFPGVCPHRRC